jgi:hypothetical protein
VSPSYEALWPLGTSTYDVVSMKPRIAELAGKRIAELFHVGFRDDEVHQL